MVSILYEFYIAKTKNKLYFQMFHMYVYMLNFFTKTSHINIYYVMRELKVNPSTKIKKNVRALTSINRIIRKSGRERER